MNHHHCNDGRCAPGCDDQLPTIATVGRGPKGDSAHIGLGEHGTCSETYVEGWETDSETGEIKSQWISENINGGRLMYQYNLRPWTMPRTFTMTFKYMRPGHEECCEWSWTTPAIPYLWSVDDGGVEEKPDHIVGSGVATLFIRSAKNKPWKEFLEYPDGFTREDFNAPEQGEAWTSNVTFGVGGDIEIPDIDDIAKIIGISIGDIKNIIEGNTIEINGIDARNLIEYIDKQDDAHLKSMLDHLHKDLGFNSTGHADKAAFEGHDTVKAYIDAKVKAVSDQNKNLKLALQALVNKVYGGGTVNDDGTISWNSPANTMSIPVGNINVLSNTTANAILTHSGDRTGDLKGE